MFQKRQTSFRELQLEEGMDEHGFTRWVRRKNTNGQLEKVEMHSLDNAPSLSTFHLIDKYFF